MAEKKKLPTVVSPVGTAAFAWLSKPDTGKKYSDDKYKVTLVLDKGDAEHQKFVAMVNAEHDKARGKKTTDSPVKDGDARNEELKEKGKDVKEEFVGKWLLTFKSKFAPQLLEYGVDGDLKPENAPRSGDRIKVGFALLPWAEGKNAGISLQMRAVKVMERRARGDYSDEMSDEGEEKAPQAEGGEKKSGGDNNKDF